MNIGTLTGESVWVDEEAFNEHALVVGPTGLGKSRFIRSLILQWIARGSGVLHLDMEGEEGRAIQASLAAVWDDIPPLRRRQMYFLSKERAWSYDPFKTDEPLDVVVDRIGQCIGRAFEIADFKEQLRRNRVLHNALYLCGAGEQYHGLHRLEDALAFGNDRWLRMFNEVGNSIPKRIAADLMRLHRAPLVQRMKETESAVNIGVPFLRGRVKQYVEPREGSLDPKEIRRRNGVVIADLEKSHLGKGQSVALASLLLHAFTYSVWGANGEFEPFYIVIDQPESIVSADFEDLCQSARKRSSRSRMCGDGACPR